MPKLIKPYALQRTFMKSGRKYNDVIWFSSERTRDIAYNYLSMPDAIGLTVPKKGTFLGAERFTEEGYVKPKRIPPSRGK